MGVRLLKTNGSKNDYVDKTAKRYSYLFGLPSHGKILLRLLIFSLLKGMLIAHLLQSSSPLDFVLTFGLILGGTFFILTVITDYTIHSLSIRQDLIFNLRRCSALSMYSVMLWLCFIVLGFFINILFNGYWVKLFFIGFCVVLAFRLMVFYAVSFARFGKVFFYSALLPSSYALPVFVYAGYTFGGNFFDVSTVLFFSLSLVTIVGAILFFMYTINNIGMRLLGVSSFSVLKAFLVNWTEDLNEPFEQFFERFGLESEIKLSVLAFKNSKHVKSIMVVPAFHPGPFKNVGSSNLPYGIQATLEKKLPECVIAVPHGLSGHDLDLASQAQNQLVLDAVKKLTEFSDYGSVATKFVRVNKNAAKVGCQIFDNSVFVTLTLAPETMEDLPPELDSFIMAMAKRLDLVAISVDAHNSIKGPFNVDEATNPIKEAVVACLKEASQQKLASIEVGVAKATPKEFGLSEGMGPGGIVLTIVKVAGQKMAYVTIDGNNMISGFREKALAALFELGLDDGEVFTTDTGSTSFADLDLSGTVGSNTAIVILKVTNDEASSPVNFVCRTNGETDDIGYDGAAQFGAGTSGATILQSNCAYVQVITDSSGVIEHRIENANRDYTINMQAYCVIS